MKKTMLWALALSMMLALSAAACQQGGGSGSSASGGSAKKSGTTLAKVGDETITLEDFQSKLDKIPPFYRKRVATKKGKMEYLDRLVQEELYYQEALSKGYADDPEIQDQLNQIKKSILAGRVKKEMMENRPEISADEVKKYYEEHKEEYETPEKVEVRHILLRVRKGDADDKAAEVEAKAKSISNDIKSGKITFEKAAEEYSEDRGSSKKGGKLPPIRKGLKSGEFDAVAFAMTKEGEVSEPFKDRRGWNIVQFISKEAAAPKPFETVEKQIERKLQQEAQRASIDGFTDNLRKRFPVTVKEDLLSDDPDAGAPDEPSMPGMPSMLKSGPDKDGE
ncbi:MAG: peptidylprolyl isomerase [Deltaproteobacteria bacterium]|nr:peptidylprolyl isomerase [Deltaproteobacteria bacterium]MCB9489528.1 peptidylprolyl isomerase [Deltaproteobacteria bacterium]